MTFQPIENCGIVGDPYSHVASRRGRGGDRRLGRPRLDRGLALPLSPGTPVGTMLAPSGIVCLAGVSSGGHTIKFDLGDINRRMVLENDIVFGSVNANRTHCEAAPAALANADHEWLSRLIKRRRPLADCQEAFVRQPHDIKVILDFDQLS